MSLIEIILKLRSSLESDLRIHAFWLDVEPGTEIAVANLFERSLGSVFTIRRTEKLEVYNEMPKLAKAKYYLEDYSDDNRIELDIQQHGREFKFDRAKNPILIIFDKDQTIKWWR